MTVPLQPGAELPPFVIPAISADAMRAWAGFLHDPNPIHLDPAFVKAKGLGERVINQGPANLAYVVNMLHAAFPGARITSMDSRFMDNAYAGDKVTATGQISEVDGKRVICAVALTSGDGRAIIQGTATLRLPD